MPPRAAEEPILGGCERRSRLRELERPHDAPPVVRVHERGGRRVERRKPKVCLLAALVVVDAPPAVARACRGRRRQPQLGERGAQIEARAADDDRRPPGGEDLVDRRMSERRVLSDRRLVVERPDRDEAHRPG